MEIIGERSEKLLQEIENLEANRSQMAGQEAKLAQEVEQRQAKLDMARAEGLIGRVDGDQVASFASGLGALQNRLSEVRSALAGIERMLAGKREELEEAKERDVQDALATEAMTGALAGLKKNATALKKTRAAILQTLEKGVATLLKEVSSDRERWAGLLAERRQLYIERRKALGTKATLGDDAFRRMEKDPLVGLFRADVELSSCRELAELLEPLIVSGRR